MPKDVKDAKVYSKRKVLIVCACIALLYLAVLVCLQAFFGARTPLLGVGSADAGNTTTIMILAAPLLAAWGFSVRVRCPDRFIGKRLVAVVGLLLVWLSIVIVKYPSHADDFVIICWYCYYIPILAIAALLFACSLRAANLEARRAGRAARVIVLCVSLCLALLVLTNNAHMQVFSFKIEKHGWSGQYSYEIGYWFILAWLILIYIISFALLFVAARKNLRPAFLPLLVVAGAGLAYCILYIFRVEFLFKTNFSLVCVILLAVAIEIIMDTGIFPSSRHYAEIFASLPLKVELVSKNGEVAYSNMSNYSNFGKCDEDILVRKFSIKGGKALTYTDVSEINERKKIAEDRNRKLADANSTLQKMLASKRELARDKSEEELLLAIDKSLQTKVSKIDKIMLELPRPDTDENKAKRREMLARVLFLTAYCKRKASLVISQTEHVMFDASQVSLIFTESASDFRSLGIEYAVFVHEMEPISPNVMEKLYDVVYEEVEIAMQNAYESMLISMSDTPDCAASHAVEVRFSYGDEDVKRVIVPRGE